MKRLLMSLAMACGVWAVGCSDDTVPPPQFNEGVDVNGRTLLPTYPPSMKDNSTILGAAASAEEVRPAKPAPAAEAASGGGKIQVDDSTPEGLWKGFVAILQAGSQPEDLGQLVDLTVPEQQEAFREYLTGAASVLKASQAMSGVWNEKFPDAPMPNVNAVSGMALKQMAEIAKNADVQAGSTEAEVTLQSPIGGPAQKVALRKIDQAWRMEVPFPGGTEAMQKSSATVPAQIDLLQGFTARLENNEFATAEEATKALVELAKQAARRAANPDTLEPAPAENPPPAAENRNPDNNRPKSGLEQDVDNAAARSVLGGF